MSDLMTLAETRGWPQVESEEPSPYCRGVLDVFDVTPDADTGICDQEKSILIWLSDRVAAVPPEDPLDNEVLGAIARVINQCCACQEDIFEAVKAQDTIRNALIVLARMIDQEEDVARELGDG